MNKKQIQEKFGDAPIFKNTANNCHQTTEGKQVWDSRSVAVTLTILFYNTDEEEYYIPMGKRGQATPDFQGSWSLPCGYIDYNENGGQAALRETWEEIGLYVEKIIAIAKSEKRFVSTFLYQPWYVNHFTKSNKQNVVLHFAVVIQCNNEKDLPELTNEFNEKIGEVEETKYFHYFRDIENSEGKEFAFDHHKLLKDFIEKGDIEPCDDDYYNFTNSCN